MRFGAPDLVERAISNVEAKDFSADGAHDLRLVACSHVNFLTAGRPPLVQQKLRLPIHELHGGRCDLRYGPPQRLGYRKQEFNTVTTIQGPLVS